MYRYIGKEIRSVSNLMHRCVCKFKSEAPVDSPVTGMQGMFLGYIYKNKDRDVFQRDLEHEFNIRRATATGILQLMEKNGLIIRKPVEHDARLKKIILTDKAYSIHSKIFERIFIIEQKMQRGISDEELKVFFDVLDKIKENLTSDD